MPNNVLLRRPFRRKRRTVAWRGGPSLIDGTLPSSVSISIVAQTPTSKKLAALVGATMALAAQTPQAAKRASITGSESSLLAQVPTATKKATVAEGSSSFSVQTPTAVKKGVLSGSLGAFDSQSPLAVKKALIGGTEGSFEGQDPLVGDYPATAEATFIAQTPLAKKLATAVGVSDSFSVQIPTAIKKALIAGSQGTFESQTFVEFEAVQSAEATFVAQVPTATKKAKVSSRELLPSWQNDVVGAFYPGIDEGLFISILEDRSGTKNNGVLSGDDDLVADADCILKLSADAGVTLAGSGVSVWADQSGNGNDLNQATPSLQPTVITRNGLPWLRFDDQQLARTGYIGSGENHTVIVVGLVQTINTDEFPPFLLLFDGNTSVGGANRLLSLYYNNSTNEPLVSHRNLGGAGSSLSWAKDQPLVITGKYDGTSTYAYVDGVVSTAGAASTGSIVAGGLVQIGRASGTHIDVAEIRVYDRALTNTEISQITGALKRKWLGAANDTWVYDSGGYALKFDGIDDLVTIPGNSAYDTLRGCWSFWIKNNGVWGSDNGSGGAGQGYAILMSRPSDATHTGINVAVGSIAGSLRLDVRSVSSQTQASNLTNNGWHNVIINWSTIMGETVDGIVDGTTIMSFPIATTWSWANNTPIYLASEATDFFEEYAGLMDDVVILPRKATADEIALLSSARGAGYTAFNKAQVANTPQTPQSRKQASISQALASFVAQAPSATKRATPTAGSLTGTCQTPQATKQATTSQVSVAWEAQTPQATKQATTSQVSVAWEAQTPNAQKRATLLDSFATFTAALLEEIVPLVSNGIGWTIASRFGWKASSRERSWQAPRKSSWRGNKR